jgi:hypothetical protein
MPKKKRVDIKLKKTKNNPKKKRTKINSPISKSLIRKSSKKDDDMFFFETEFKNDYLESKKWVIKRRKLLLKIGILIVVSIILILILVSSITYFL